MSSSNESHIAGMRVGADKKKWKIVPTPTICILRSQRICIDLRNDCFAPEKAEIHRSAEKSHP